MSFDANDVEIPVYLKFKKTDEDGLHKLKENSLKLHCGHDLCIYCGHTDRQSSITQSAVPVIIPL